MTKVPPIYDPAPRFEALMPEMHRVPTIRSTTHRSLVASAILIAAATPLVAQNGAPAEKAGVIQASSKATSAKKVAPKGASGYTIDQFLSPSSPPLERRPPPR